MQKLLLSILFVLALVAAPVSQAASQSSPAVALTWTNQPTPNFPPCSATVTNTCSWYYSVIEVTVPSAPVTLNAPNTLAVTATSYTTPAYANNTFATRLYNLVLVYKDGSGATQQDAPATCGSANTAPPCAVSGIPVAPPASPTNFSGTAVTQ